MLICGALLLPKTKFRYIGDKQHPDLYEFKKNDIRVYVIMRKPNIFVAIKVNKTPILNELRNYSMTFKR